MARTGFNTVRIIPEFVVWDEQHDGFMDRFERYISLADKYGISCMVVLANDCMRPKSFEVNKIGVQNVDLGYHGGRKISQHGHQDEMGWHVLDDMSLAPRYFEMVKEIVKRGWYISFSGVITFKNASKILEAVKAVIGFAGTMADRHRLVFVIGSLLELGDASRDIHREIGTELGKSNAAGIFLFGKETEGAEEGLAGAAGISIFRTEDYAELEAAVCSFVKAGDLVVVKGSRGMELERIVNKLKDRGIDNV